MKPTPFIECKLSSTNLFRTVFQNNVDIFRVFKTVIKSDDIEVDQVAMQFNLPGNLKMVIGDVEKEEKYKC